MLAVKQAYTHTHTHMLTCTVFHPRSDIKYIKKYNINIHRAIFIHEAVSQRTLFISEYPAHPIHLTCSRPSPARNTYWQKMIIIDVIPQPSQAWRRLKPALRRGETGDSTGPAVTPPDHVGALELHCWIKVSRLQWQKHTFLKMGAAVPKLGHWRALCTRGSQLTRK